MAAVRVQMSISLPGALYKKAMAVAEAELRTKSELVREALREYIVRKQVVLEARLRLRRGLERSRIRTLGDIERMVDEGRA